SSKSMFSTPFPCASGGVREFELADQFVLPGALRAKAQAQLLRALVEEVAIGFPGEAHAAMGLSVFLRREVESLRRRNARRRGGERKLARIGRKRPGAVVGIRTRQLVIDIHIGKLVL